MTKKWPALIVSIVSLNFSWFTAPAQNSQGLVLAFGDTTIRKENVHSNKLKPASLIIPGAFLAYGSLKPVIGEIRELDDDIMSKIRTNHPAFHTNAEDYLMWVPSASIYVADAFKVKSKHSFKDHLILDVGSIIVTGSIGYGMRKIVENSKIYNSQDTKYPSGHTANAFRGAEIIFQEFKAEHRLLSYSGYVVATAVGTLRIYNKTHLFTEVLAGAGLGILSTRLTYWIYDSWKDRNRRSVSPAF